MLWEIEISPKGDDLDRSRVAEEYDLLTHTADGARLVTSASRGYLLEGDVARADLDPLVRDLLVDDLAESASARPLGEGGQGAITVLLRPGVMDPVALSVAEAAGDLGVRVESVRTFRRYRTSELSAEQHRVLDRV